MSGGGGMIMSDMVIMVDIGGYWGFGDYIKEGFGDFYCICLR